MPARPRLAMRTQTSPQRLFTVVTLVVAEAVKAFVGCLSGLRPIEMLDAFRYVA